MFYLAILLPVIFTLCFPTTADTYDFRLGYISGYDDYSLGGAAISLALDRARKEGLLVNDTFSIIYKTNGCSPADAMAAAIELVLLEEAHVVFGPYCSPDDKHTYPTLVRCRPSYNTMGSAFKEIFRQYNWERTIIFSQESSTCHYGAKAIYEEFEWSNIKVTEWVRLHDDTTQTLIEEKARHIKNKARVVILCHTWPVIESFMLVADRLGMTTPEYTYLHYKMSPDPNNPQPFHVEGENATEEQLAARRRILAVFKQVTGAYYSDDNAKRFTEMLEKRHALPPWKPTGDKVVIPDGSLPAFMALSDCTYLYLVVLDEIMDEGGNTNDGRLIAQKSRRKQFDGFTGRVTINDNADRIPDYWLWDCYPESLLCDHYAIIHLADPVGIEVFKDPFWPTEDGEPPPDKPKCGYTGDLCKTGHTVTIIVASVLSVAFLASLVTGVIVFRERQREKEVQMMTWQIKYEEIEFKTEEGSNVYFQSGASLPSHHSHTAAGTDNLIPGTYCQLLARTGLYNGTMVTVKCVKKRSINLTREILVELKTMKDMIHENVNTFIGACVHPPHICYLTAYCSKGNLQDIIENDDIKLDWLFKSSLLNDLINVSGFGLGHFTKGSVCDKLSECKRYERMLWTAPELLRLTDGEKPTYGTRKGDVYSFAIILQEVIYRSKPFFDKLPPKEIVSRVTQIQKVPYRPELPKDTLSSDVQQAIQELMILCWAELPALRPTFVEIKKRFNIINKGRRFNIMDNMVSMLESYANNLEGLVQQRTNELVEEKKKTDKLLYQMLPALVADRLKRGLSVEPEMFDAVSIYFSDIVGFTSLASESTPMEVVTFLNDLYTTFDRTVEKYDVYKVETIGDAYMVVSGLPKRNGNRHITEIADLSLDLLNEVLSFRIHHRPDRALLLRIGLHTGPCAAGVVGKTMPRYCLFGDTVNMASRMESTGEAQKIHISEAAMKQLSKHNRYQCVYRGETAVKGKGIVNTYWLMSKRDD